MKKKTKNRIVNVCVVIAICLLIFYALIPLFMITGIWDYFIYNKSVSTKEDVFRMVEDNQEEFERIVDDMRVLLEQSDENVIILRGRRECRSHGVKSSLLIKYPISTLSIYKAGIDVEIKFYLGFCPKGYTYWGIYYMENDDPSPWGSGNLKEENGIYTQQIKGSYKYETEKIMDHWYYFQCWSR